MFHDLHLVLLALSLARTFQPCRSQPQVKLNGTAINGKSIQVIGGLQQDFFGGSLSILCIPYADAARFQAPVPRILNTSTLDATAFGPPCPQTGAGGASEDCLTLDVLRPTPVPNTLADSSSLAVMVWIYGGNFLNGQSSAYNASGLLVESVARGTPVIFVSINYRTGPFGFPQGQEAEQRGALNLGIKDMFAALTWVQSNIGAFGGDNSKVTVFGQSAGAVSIALMTLSLGFERIARAAIFESGSHSTIPIYNATVRETSWQTFAQATPGCAGASSDDTFGCLQAADLPTLISSLGKTIGVGSQEFPFPPVIDGDLIPDLPSTLIAQGQFARIPFIAGTVQDEGTSFVSTSLNATDNEGLVDTLATRDLPFQSSLPTSFNDAAGTLVALYPDDPSSGSPFGTGNNTFGFNPEYKRMAAIVGDFEYQALRRAWSTNATSVEVKNYAYMFAVPDARNTGSPWLGINHASEIPYVLGEILLDTSSHPTSNLACVMIMNYWLSFATSLDPNDGRGNIGRPQWSTYDNSNASVLLMGGTFSMVSDDYRESQIASINSSPAVFAH